MKKSSRTLKIVLLIVVLIFVLAAVYYANVWAYSANSNDSNACTDNAIVSESARAIAAPVVVTSVVHRKFKDRIHIQGNMEAKNYAMVSPRIAGTIEKIFVDEGDHVIEGETKLFQIDAVKLEKALEIARQDVAVIRCALLERKANQEKVEANLYKAQLDYKRFEELLKKEVVTANDFEIHELHFKQAKASTKHAQTSVDLAREQVSQAEAALAIAEKDLQDTIIYAPLTGTVSRRFMEPGEMGDVGKPVLRIEDTSMIEVSAFLPSHDYNKITVDKTSMDIEVNGVNVKDQIIIYKSPTINPTLRTFEIKSVIKDPPGGVVPGALAEIEVTFGTRNAIGVPSICVLPRRERQIVFVVREGKAHAYDVVTGWENEGWIEITGDVKADMSVVSMGQNQLNDGTLVNVQKEGR